MQVIHKIQNELDTQKKVVLNFQTLFVERERIEKQYGKKIYELAERMENQCGYLDPQTETRNCLLTLASCMKVQGEQILSFANTLQEQNMELDQKFRKIISTFQQEHDHIKYMSQQFYQIGQDLEKRKGNFYQGVVKNLVPRDEKYCIEEGLEQCVNTYNYHCQQTNHSLQKIQKENQEYEKQRQQHMKDASIQYIINFVSQVKNLEYDSQNIAKKLQENEEINEFVVSKRLDDYLEKVLPIDITLLKTYLATEYKPSKQQVNTFDYNDDNVTKEFNKVLKKVSDFFKLDVKQPKTNQKIQQDNFMATAQQYTQKKIGIPDIISMQPSQQNQNIEDAQKKNNFQQQQQPQQQQQNQGYQPLQQQKKKFRTKIFDDKPIKKVELNHNLVMQTNNNINNLQSAPQEEKKNSNENQKQKENIKREEVDVILEQKQKSQDEIAQKINNQLNEVQVEEKNNIVKSEEKEEDQKESEEQVETSIVKEIDMNTDENNAIQFTENGGKEEFEQVIQEQEQ